MNLDKITIQQQRNPFHLAYSSDAPGTINFSLEYVQKTTETKIKKKDLLNFIKNNSYVVYKNISDITIETQLITTIVKESNEIAKSTRRGAGNILLCGKTIYNFLILSENWSNYYKKYDIYLSDELANNEIIITYKSKFSNQAIVDSDGGIFVADAETDDEIYVSTFNLNDISNTKNYYRHIIFENLK